MIQITPQIAVASLNSTICPCCGKRKARAHSLAGGCYHALPADMKQALYRKVGRGYEAALSAALEFRGCERLYLPEEVPQ